jgi:MoaA/NifB/PqqE/SkfB family radical SAM enzyme
MERVKKLLELAKINRAFVPFLFPYRRVKSKWLRHRMIYGQTIPLPRYITFEVTQRCNLRCKMCFYKKNEIKKELSLKEIYSLFSKKIKPFGIKNCYITGAEPFVRRDIQEIISIITSFGITITIQTNGTFSILKRIPKLYSLRPMIKSFGLSIDGLERTHDKIRGMEGGFKKAIENLELLHKLKIYTIVNVTILEENIEEIPELVRFLSAKGADEITLQLVVNYTSFDREKGRQIVKLKEEELHTVVLPELEFSSSYEHVLKVLTSCVKIGKDLGRKVLLTPIIGAKYFKDLFYRTIRDRIPLSCGSLYSLRIAPDGFVIYCPFIRKRFGNLLNTSLPDIWNSNEFKEFRCNLLLSNLLPTCSRCGKLKAG